ncbi:unnamed protein product, partial [Tilletia controversa]
PELVKDALKSHFDQLFRGATDTHSLSTTLISPTSSNARDHSSTSTSSSTVNFNAIPACNHTPTALPSLTPPSNPTPLGLSRIANHQPNQPVSAVSMSPAALKAIRSNGSWKGWIYCGVVRWEGGTTDSRPLTDDEILQRSRQVKKKSRGSTSKKTPKGDKVLKPTTRAEDFHDLRERWQCTTCGKLRHEKIATTSNLRKHRRDCGTTAGTK